MHSNSNQKVNRKQAFQIKNKKLKNIKKFEESMFILPKKEQ